MQRLDVLAPFNMPQQGHENQSVNITFELERNESASGAIGQLEAIPVPHPRPDEDLEHGGTVLRLRQRGHQFSTNGSAEVAGGVV